VKLRALGFGLWALGTAALPALGAPPDLRMILTSQKPRIEKIDPEFTLADSDDANVVHAEILPSGELLLEPKNAGTAHVFIYASRLVRVLEVAFDAALPAADPKPPKTCETKRIAAACYMPWRAYLQHVPTGEVPPIDLEVETIQAELTAAQAALGKAGMNSVQLRFSSFGVKLKGAKDEREERRAMQIIWPWLLGPLRIDR
jgi:hypothetical protein